MRGEPATRIGKRPLRALSAAEKMDAIQRVHDGESKAAVARDIGVPESTLRGWCKSEHKIRGMARNSCTPDSEAHSPASGTVNPTNFSMVGNSEDEGYVAKRQKLDTDHHHHSTSASSEHLEIERANKIDGQQKIDYAALMASVAAMRPDGGGSLLLQQLGLLSSATNAINKNLLQVPSGGGGGGGTQSSAVVGLVENGLQYTRNTGTAKRQQQSTSAAAPTQLDTVEKSGSRNILPPAAEAPFAPSPASPRKTNEHSQHLGKSKKENENDTNVVVGGGNAGSVGNKVDEALWLWLTQQQQLLGQQSAIFNPSSNQELGGSWFWKWYKQYGFAPAAAAAAAQAASTPSLITKKSPTKAKAMLDNVLGNNNNNNHNNNENTKRSPSAIQEQQNDTTADVKLTTEEAISHGETFLKWLEICSEPSVSRMQIMQFRYLLDNLKTCRKPTSTSKRSRK